MIAWSWTDDKSLSKPMTALLLTQIYPTWSRWVNTLRPRQNGRLFADDTFKRIFVSENVWISIKMSLKFVYKGQINNIPALVQIMAWRRPGDKPLSEPMVVRLPTLICVTRPQWVNDVMSICDMTLNFVIVIFSQSDSRHLGVISKAQRAHDAMITSVLRQNDVETSFGRNDDVIIASCARCRVAFFSTLTPNVILQTTAPACTT